jgi:hypothetical protein
MQELCNSSRKIYPDQNYENIVSFCIASNIIYGQANNIKLKFNRPLKQNIRKLNIFSRVAASSEISTSHVVEVILCASLFNL